MNLTWPLAPYQRSETMKIEIHVQCPAYDSFRVRQTAGMFDVPLREKLERTFSVDVPDNFAASLANPADADWKIGLIVGPSGSGKTTLARKMFGDSFVRPRLWADDKAVIDGLGDGSIRDLTGLFTAVGFSSPPSWAKPYSVLSNGERFRCDLARAIKEGTESNRIVAFDEFTSVVDRTVARSVSAALAKGIKSRKIPCRFAAVTCHYDVESWLEPDWTIDMATQTFQWRRLRRPDVRLETFRCTREAWKLFAHHHYLSGSLAPPAECYLATWEGEPTAFCATLPLIGQKGRRRITRLVTLPDFQGLGIGMALAETVGEIMHARGLRLNITTGHPAAIGHCKRSVKWRTVQARIGAKAPRKHAAFQGYRNAAGRATVSFEFVG